jgi:hypothetical protein
VCNNFLDFIASDLINYFIEFESLGEVVRKLFVVSFQAFPLTVGEK